MDEQLVKHLQNLRKFYGKNPKWLTNEMIEKYLVRHCLQYDNDLLLKFKEYYLSMGSYRRIFDDFLYDLILAEEYMFTTEEISDVDCKGGSGTLTNEVATAPSEPDRDAGPPLIPQFERFLTLLRIQKYSPKTIKNYTSALKSVAHYFNNKNRSIDLLDHKDLVEYFYTLSATLDRSASTVRIHRFALAFYYNNVLQKEIDISDFMNIRKEKKLPTVLTHNEIKRILSSINNLKHRVMISLLYSSGLRVSEVVVIRVKDLDFEHLTLTVRQGKGKKDRVTIFSESIASLVQEFCFDKGPGDYLFIRQGDKDMKHHVTVRTVQNAFFRALKKSGVKKVASCHSLRHSFATHLLESGVSVRHIQELLGHKHINTTTIYTKVAHPALSGIKSPL